MKDKIREIVFDFFVKSSDFNGIPLRRISKDLNIDYTKSIDFIKELVKEDVVSIQSSTNPHIIGFKHHDVADQLNILESAKEIKVELIKLFGDFTMERENTEYPICVYPSKRYLRENRNLNSFGNAVYTKELALGEPSLSSKYFELDVLERYSNDPRFRFDLKNYSGQIYAKYDDDEKPISRKEDNIFLKSFGLGLDSKGNRVVIVYLRYLKGLKEEPKLYRKGKEAQNESKMVAAYYENTVLGVWSNSYSIFTAFLGELSCLNELSKIIFGISLFRQNFDDDKRPIEFNFLLSPTRKNYYAFILILDKMISENLNKKFFEGKVELFSFSELEDGLVERRNKGTLRLFQEWFLSHYNSNQQNDLLKVFIPFKKVRKLRQKPAHSIDENIYDVSLIDDQKEIIESVYYAMKAFRQMFQQHPSAVDFSIPKWLDNGDIIIL